MPKAKQTDKQNTKLEATTNKVSDKIKLSELNTNEFYYLLKITQNYCDYISKHLHINQNNSERYSKWFKLNEIAQTKLTMMYTELNKRIQLIEE